MVLLALTILSIIGVLVFLIKLGILAQHRVHIKRGQYSRDDWPSVTIVIPARNEEHNLKISLGSILEQDYPVDKLEVIVVDDFSEDQTRQVAQQMMSQSQFNAQCISGRPLPKGWIGKSNACMAGALQANGEYIFFIDADTQSDKKMLKSIIDFTLSKEIDLLSFNPRQLMLSASEKTLLPGLFLSIASFMKFHESNDPDKEEAIANGQAMLFKTSAYKAVEGHTVVASEISEDLAFAKAMKERKFNIFWAFADDLMSTRMYTSAAEIWHGFSKNMNRIVEVNNFASAITLLSKSFFIAWSTPLLLLLSWLSYNSEPTQIALFVVGINLLMQLILLITYGVLATQLFVPIIYAIFVPFGITLQGLLVINSYRLSKQKSISWKGRVVE
ncbi:glycosyltransferase [Photobacterium sp. ZSDE20]|uniref:Glycosyltransferase n=1 Tax=Photobacterium pectinilyticum TaxID=2906793 RepID=A0ABT1N302_9GAMM|nr:glycosyltransferase [Photobacterium sp. ZSDE20]MCQ1059118.1 glycosyltransferase [Photobacterium sp. ZSDE20]MDD1824349.1 glycosyltransferase [Photobacterium sp. ZSDE20]